MLLNRPDTLYLYDGKNDTYHRLTGGTSRLWINDIYNSVNLLKKPEDVYRSIEDRFNLISAGLAKYNLSDENTLLTPVHKTLSFEKYSTINEIGFGPNSDNELEKIAKNLFGEDLSFVKKSVYSDKSTIYMYGYGEKVFKINSDGSLEYSVNGAITSEKTALSFQEGLNKSIDRIQKMGIEIESIYLADYYQIEASNSFETVYAFNYTVNGIPFYTDDTVTNDMVVVRFTNDDLVKLRKHTKIVTPMSTVFQSTISFQNVLAREGNRLLIELNFKEDNPNLIVEPLDTALMASQAMEKLDTVYYVKNDELIPCWHIRISNTNYLVDLTTGIIINHYKE
jgi:hypothetical protein